MAANLFDTASGIINVIGQEVRALRWMPNRDDGERRTTLHDVAELFHGTVTQFDLDGAVYDAVMVDGMLASWMRPGVRNRLRVTGTVIVGDVGYVTGYDHFRDVALGEWIVAAGISRSVETHEEFIEGASLTAPMRFAEADAESVVAAIESWKAFDSIRGCINAPQDDDGSLSYHTGHWPRFVEACAASGHDGDERVLLAELIDGGRLPWHVAEWLNGHANDPEALEPAAPAAEPASIPLGEMVGVIEVEGPAFPTLQWRPSSGDGEPGTTLEDFAELINGTIVRSDNETFTGRSVELGGEPVIGLDDNGTLWFQQCKCDDTTTEHHIIHPGADWFYTMHDGSLASMADVEFRAYNRPAEQPRLARHTRESVSKAMEAVVWDSVGLPDLTTPADGSSFAELLAAALKYL